MYGRRDDAPYAVSLIAYSDLPFSLKARLTRNKANVDSLLVKRKGMWLPSLFFRLQKPTTLNELRASCSAKPENFKINKLFVRNVTTRVYDASYDTSTGRYSHCLGKRLPAAKFFSTESHKREYAKHTIGKGKRLHRAFLNVPALGRLRPSSAEETSAQAGPKGMRAGPLAESSTVFPDPVLFLGLKSLSYFYEFS